MYRVIETLRAIPPEVYVVEKGFEKFVAKSFSSNEGEALKILNHPGIVRFVDKSKITKNEFMGFDDFMIMENLKGGALDELDFPLPLKEAIEYGRNIAEIMSYIDKNKMVHGDIKPEHYVLHEKSGKLVDFEFSGRVNERGYADCLGYTLEYVAPEVVFLKRVYPKSEVYSLGLTVFEMLHPQGQERYVVKREILNDIFNDPEEYTEEEFRIARGYTGFVTSDDVKRIDNCELLGCPKLVSLIECMVEIDMGKRPTIQEVVERLKEL